MEANEINDDSQMLLEILISDSSGFNKEEEYADINDLYLNEK